MTLVVTGSGLVEELPFGRDCRLKPFSNVLLRHTCVHACVENCVCVQEDVVYIFSRKICDYMSAGQAQVVVLLRFHFPSSRLIVDFVFIRGDDLQAWKAIQLLKDIPSYFISCEQPAVALICPWAIIRSQIVESYSFLVEWYQLERIFDPVFQLVVHIIYQGVFAIRFVAANQHGDLLRHHLLDEICNLHWRSDSRSPGVDALHTLEKPLKRILTYSIRWYSCISVAFNTSSTSAEKFLVISITSLARSQSLTLLSIQLEDLSKNLWYSVQLLASIVLRWSGNFFSCNCRGRKSTAHLQLPSRKIPSLQGCELPV